MTISFVSRGNEPGIEIRDSVERRTCTLHTSDAVHPTSADTELFHFPVDDAVTISTDGLRLPTPAAVYVRDECGEMLASVEGIGYEELSEGTYNLELCTPIKLYVRVEGSLRVSGAFDSVAFDFDGETTVRVGARSSHRRPAETVTTTADPVDVMAAISTFGSALKTTSPERSFPTLRGHPPTIELGDRLEIPDELSPPDAGIRIEIPPRYESIFPVAPLAYYLGAELAPGRNPRIVTDDFEHPLRTARGFENEVERVLKQTFLLDCVTRTEGFYRIDLHERQRVEPLADLDFAALYDAPVAERLEAYLSVPYAVVEEFVPDWQLTTHVEPTSESVEMLPFLVDDLAVVRTPRATEVSSSVLQTPAVDEFVRGGDSTRSAVEAPASVNSLVEPEATDSLEQMWVGEDAPVGASKATAAAFRNRLERTATSGDIDITVVCNDRQMDEERTLADEVYGSREELPFDVTVRNDLSTAELRAVLESETQFLHYIGHIDEGGFECVDGMLDARELDSVGIEAFFLNACQSYEQGMALIEAGAVGGVVTLNDVINSGAVRVGRTMIRLLNRGFPLWAALDIARDRSIIGGQYIVVGDGCVNIVQTESIVALLYDIETKEDVFELTPITYHSNDGGIGGFVTPQFSGQSTSYLASGSLPTVTLTDGELEEYLLLENVPVHFDGRFTWSYEIDTDER
ncbi:CHAT domain-containing protein [Haladaptatus salinisoli]|uniref:CHAT domain-containing protein n=1 Tax=Haladaptatus salinisoli TaxID=2884876 RepID=UPI001D09D442|nr:CHAT domain-containing protein [Haladaptatus salinisoli]